mgnify:CR=1 FL=1
MDYYLMNKDNIIFRFNISRDALGVRYSLIGNIQGVMPRDLKDLGKWIEKRHILSHRNDIEILFRSIGINDIESIIDITHCVAITDTFWIKRVNSSKKWENVSPYRNSLNKVISDFSFNGEVNGKNITSSPDFSTGGNFPKCWKKNNGSLYLYKAGSDGAINAGNEPYSEIFAYQLAKYLDIDCIEYKYGHYKEKDVSICKNMCSEEIGLIALSDVVETSAIDFKKILDMYKSRGIEQDVKRCVDMLLLDALTCNIDRHLGNISHYINNDTQEILGMSKIYDNNLALIPYYYSYESGCKPLEYVDSLRAKDGRTFNELYALIKSNYTRKKLIKAQDFKFKSIGVKSADERLTLLNIIVKYRVKECLKV